MTAPQIARTKPRFRWKWLLYLGVAIALIIAIKNFNFQSLLKQALDRVGQLGPRGALLFIAIYVVATVLFIPSSVLTLGAGAVFGLGWGLIYVSIGSTLGATCAFLVGRYVARNWVARRIEGHPTFAAMDRAIADEGWKMVGLTRLSPVFPFTLLNYAFGLTRVKLSHYVIASWIGMIPGTILYVYLGSLARAGAEARQRTPAQWALYAVGLLATIALTVVVTRRARRALNRRIEPASSNHE
jgi:uncharacterized membrane protein YdjX (TVP38/TMEM64 family)